MLRALPYWLRCGGGDAVGALGVDAFEPEEQDTATATVEEVEEEVRFRRYREWK